MRVTTIFHTEPTLISDLLNLALEQKKWLERVNHHRRNKTIKANGEDVQPKQPRRSKNETFRDEMERLASFDIIDTRVPN